MSDHVLRFLQVVDDVGGQGMEIWSAVMRCTSYELGLAANRSLILGGHVDVGEDWVFHATIFEPKDI